LLDYGYEVDLPLQESPARERPLLAELLRQALLIAAGGNTGARDRTGAPTATAPGVYPEVLAVGSVDSDGKLPAYAEWTPSLSKPDIFMLDQLAGTALESALKEESFTDVDGSGVPRTAGSSFAALHAMATAILIWSMRPELTPEQLRDLLRRASRPMDGAFPKQPLVLTVSDAVAQARREMIREALVEGPCSLQTLAAITGLELRLLSEMLASLETKGAVRHLTRGRLERYELVTNQ
jgi:hypothetical protein